MVDEITTKRLRWRPIRTEDADLYHPLMSEWDVVRMLGGWPWPPDPAFTAERCANPPDAYELLGTVFLGDEMIGSLGFHDHSFGYLIGPAHWGRGYATEIGQAMIGEAFRRYDWDEITAVVWADNPASDRVLLKLGFQQTGQREEYSKARGVDFLSYDYVLTRADWEARDGH